MTRLDIPSLVVIVSSSDVLEETEVWGSLKEAVQRTMRLRAQPQSKEGGRAGGISAIVLRQDGADEKTGAQRLYDAGILAQSFLDSSGKGIPLILRGRPDVASACECTGVLLKESDIPTVAAKRILTDGRALVLREVSSAEDARKNAEEGAAALVLNSKNWDALKDVKSNQRGAASIPVFAALPERDGQEPMELADFDGIVGTMRELQRASEQLSGKQDLSNVESSLMSMFGSDSAELKGKQRKGQGEASLGVESKGPGASGGETLGELRDSIHDALSGLRVLLREQAPRLVDGVEGIGEKLIMDALLALDDPVLLVIVGEFNSGKSSVINALLGQNLLPVGVVPTTNEVCMLRYGAKKYTEQREDGIFVNYIPSEVLKQLSIVDTPGTNVVVGRQQKLTEDFIPKADIVLFILSADRPLTESETQFMSYIKQWGKKTMFAVNKKELLDKREVREVCDFVQQNASQILGVDKPSVFPISAKLALAGLNRSGGEWGESGFQGLLDVVNMTLDQKGVAMQLKFNTASSLGQSLAGALKEQIKVQQDALEQESQAIDAVSTQLGEFKKEMRRDASVQYASMDSVLDSAMTAVDEITDSILSLGNAKAVSSYVLSSDSGLESTSKWSTMDVLRNFQNGLETLVAENKVWLVENCNEQCSYYSNFVAEKTDVISRISFLPSKNSSPERIPEAGQIEAIKLDIYKPIFSAQALSTQLENSIKEAATSSFGTAGAAVVFTFVLTLILNNIQEDLLALAFGGAIAYLSVLSIPLQRAKVKTIFRAKVKESTSPLQEELRKRLNSVLDETVSKVEARMVPLKETIQKKKEQLANLQVQQTELESRLQVLQDKINAIHIQE